MAKGYTTEALVEAEIGKSITATTVPTSTQVAAWIEEVEDYIDDLTGTSFTSVTQTDEVYPWNEHNTFVSVTSGNRLLSTGRWDYGRSGSRNSFSLGYKPIISMTSLSINGASDSAADSWTALTENTGSGGDYVVDYNTGAVTFITNLPLYGERAIKATFAYGYSSIPGVVKTLATYMVARRTIAMKIKQQQYTTTDTVTLASLSIKKESSQAVTMLRELDESIARLEAQVGELIVEIA